MRRSTAPTLTLQQRDLLRRGLQGPVLIRNKETARYLLDLGLIREEGDVRSRLRLNAFVTTMRAQSFVK